MKGIASFAAAVCIGFVSVPTSSLAQESLLKWCGESGLVETINSVALRPISPACQPKIIDLFCRAVVGESVLELNKELQQEGCLDKYSRILPSHQSRMLQVIAAQKQERASPVPVVLPESEMGMMHALPGVRYLHISHFMRDDADVRVARALTGLAPTDRLILDLRGNLGGRLDMAVTVSMMFAPSQGSTLGMLRRVSGDYAFIAERRGILARTPTLILVDHSTASAGELVAAMARHASPKFVRIMGRTTYGKASSLMAFLYPKGDPRVEVSITNAEVTIGLSALNRLEGKGVVPDYPLTAEFMRGGAAAITDSTVMHALKFHGFFNK